MFTFKQTKVISLHPLILQEQPICFKAKNVKKTKLIWASYLWRFHTSLLSVLGCLLWEKHLKLCKKEVLICLYFGNNPSGGGKKEKKRQSCLARIPKTKKLKIRFHNILMKNSILFITVRYFQGVRLSLIYSLVILSRRNTIQQKLQINMKHSLVWQLWIAHLQYISARRINR